MPSKMSRIFVCDPVCALPYGHNVLGLKYFSDFLKPSFPLVVPVASRHLPDDVAAKYGFEREFGFYYAKHIDIDTAAKDKTAYRSRSTRYSDDALSDATHDVRQLIAKFDLTRHDSIFYPCADYYGVIATLEVMREVGVDHAPSCFFRLIGVMENATASGEAGLPRVVSKIRKALTQGLRVAVCAETPRYADLLAEKLEIDVTVVAYPTNAALRASPVESGDGTASTDPAPFNVICPGSARLDKGYLDLFQIFSSLRRVDPDLGIRFVTQSLPISEALNHWKYTNQLYAIPGTRLLSSGISEERMNELYETADLVLLPYDRRTYEYRGSAVFMECICRGIPVVALDGPAFCEQIRYYGAGSVLREVHEFPGEILRYRELSRQSRHLRSKQARHRYSFDADRALSQWIAR